MTWFWVPGQMFGTWELDSLLKVYLTVKLIWIWSIRKTVWQTDCWGFIHTSRLCLMVECTHDLFSGQGRLANNAKFSSSEIELYKPQRCAHNFICGIWSWVGLWVCFPSWVLGPTLKIACLHSSLNLRRGHLDLDLRRSLGCPLVVQSFLGLSGWDLNCFVSSKAQNVKVVRTYMTIAYF